MYKTKCLKITANDYNTKTGEFVIETRGKA